MQSRISAFFKPTPTTSSPAPKADNDDFSFWANNEHVHINTYKRRAPKSDGLQSKSSALIGEKDEKPVSANLSSKSRSANFGKSINKNKKRSYAQLHLEIGQSDFLLHTCSTCGLRYSTGAEVDEDVHKTFHKNYTHGVQCKGWRNEMVVAVPSVGEDRITVVTESDPTAQRKKVQDVIKMMEMELGCGWIYHKRCKVYLFISSKRISGCLVAEPINEAFKIIPSCIQRRTIGPATKERKSVSPTLHFGEILFQREVTKRIPADQDVDISETNQNGAILCEKDAVPAVCGIRAIWVTPSNRRKRIATHLLDALRESFCPDYVLEKSKLAFSDPTSSGKALAFNYFGTESFLVYKADSPDC